MELHPNARVLPSNAPALPEDATGLSSTSTDVAETLPSEIYQNYDRGNHSSAYGLKHVCLHCKQHGHPATDCECGVLRVTSGNVRSCVIQSRTKELKTGSAPKYEFRPVSSLINPPHHSAQAAIKAGHPRRQQHLSWSSLEGPPWYWHVEWETPRYQEYRKKLREKGSKNEKWSDRVEEAFQMAIRLYRRRGRKKHNLHGKASGGNEFIADFIEQQTGEKRDRKQVSSHIQVEKNFLRENKAWMSLVADIKSETSNKKARGSGAHEEAATTYENDDASIYRPPQASLHPFPDRLLAPFDILVSNQGPAIRRVSEFTMTLEDKRDCRILRHTYTSLQSEMPSAPKALADVKNWRDMYPALADDHDRGPIDCPVYLFDTHLSLMDRPDPSHLRIEIYIDFSQGAHFTGWRSYTKFYEQNGCPVGRLKPSDDLESAQVEGTDNTRLALHFRARWWSSVFSRLMEKKQMIESSGDPVLIREQEERASQYIQGLSIMQEVWATHGASNRGPQRMAILLWSFSTARRGVAATTSWRRLLPTLSAYDIQSPRPPVEQSPMTIDTSLQAASPYAAHQMSQPSIFSGYHTGELLTAPLTEASSPSTTPTPESRSFASSASDSTYTLCPSQESFPNPQDSAYPALSIFDSQDSGYSLYEHHEVVEASHQSYASHEFADGSQEAYGSQEVMYHSQDSLYQPVSDQLYEYPYEIVDPPITASASQDFTGGQIQLSYAQNEESQSTYEAPLIAPRANMVPQHQLIQHPEHFDQHEYLDQNPEELGGGHDELEEPGHAEPLAQAYELNGLPIDCSGWEETLRLNPDLEQHLGLDVVEEVGRMGQQYMSAVGQDAIGPTQAEGMGEIQGEEGTRNRQLEYQ